MPQKAPLGVFAGAFALARASGCSCLATNLLGSCVVRQVLPDESPENLGARQIVVFCIRFQSFPLAFRQPERQHVTFLSLGFFGCDQPIPPGRVRYHHAHRIYRAECFVNAALRSRHCRQMASNQVLPEVSPSHPIVFTDDSMDLPFSCVRFCERI